MTDPEQVKRLLSKLIEVGKWQRALMTSEGRATEDLKTDLRQAARSKRLGEEGGRN